MARIRTIKPGFFRHEGLFELEKRTGLPVRLAFAGLWTSCDRQGRFEWLPRTLKLDCLPHDEVDFSRVLDALASRGSVVRYRVNDKDYGYIPSWQDHQFINNKEPNSILPEPNEINELTRGERVANASESRGDKEGKGKDRERNRERKEKGASKTRDVILPDWMPLEEWNNFLEYRKLNKKPLGKTAIDLNIKKLEKLRAQGEDPVECINEAIARGWLSFFPVNQKKEYPNGKQNRITNDIYDKVARDIERIEAGSKEQPRASEADGIIIEG